MKRYILMCLFAFGIVFSAAAETISTFPQNGYMTYDQTNNTSNTYTGAATYGNLGVYSNTEQTPVVANAWYKVNAGYYLPANTAVVASCPAGYYCPGSGNNGFEVKNVDQGNKLCGAGMYSTGGTSSCTVLPAGYYGTNAKTANPTSVSDCVNQTSGNFCGSCSANGYDGYTSSPGAFEISQCYKTETTTCANAMPFYVSNGTVVYKTPDGTASPSSVNCKRYRTYYDQTTECVLMGTAEQCLPTGLNCNVGYEEIASSVSLAGLDLYIGHGDIWFNEDIYEPNGDYPRVYNQAVWADGSGLAVYGQVVTSATSANSLGAKADSVSSVSGNNCWVRLTGVQYPDSTERWPIRSNWVYMGQTSDSGAGEETCKNAFYDNYWHDNAIVPDFYQISCQATPVYKFALDSNNGNDNVLPSQVYTRRDVGVYSDMGAADQMNNSYKIDVLEKIPFVDLAVFTGFYTEQTGGVKVIDFDGHFTAAAITAVPDGTGAYPDEGTWYAQYDKLYPVNLHPNGGEINDDYVFATSAGVVYLDENGFEKLGESDSIDTPVRIGYNFAGFYTTESGGDKIFDENGRYVRTISGGNQDRLYAHWEPKTYTCAAGTYVKAGEDDCVTCSAGYYCTGGTYEYNDENQGDFACEGNTWSDGGASVCTACATGYAVTGSEHNSQDDCKKTITLNKNGGIGTINGTAGNAVASIICSEATNCDFGSASGLTQDGYVFTGGWRTSVDCSDTTTAFTTPSADTYYACKSGNVIHITWTGVAASAGGDENGTKTTTVSYGGDIVTPEASVAGTGQVFLGWKFVK